MGEAFQGGDKIVEIPSQAFPFAADIKPMPVAEREGSALPAVPGTKERSGLSHPPRVLPREDLDWLPVVVLRLHADGRIAQLNAASLPITGIVPTDLIKDPDAFWKCVPASDREELRAHRLNTGRDRMSQCFRIRNQVDGRIYHIREQLTVLRAPNGDIEGFDGCWIDATRETHAEARLLRSAISAAGVRMCRGMLHELANLIAGMQAVGAPPEGSTAMLNSAMQARDVLQNLGSALRRGRAEPEFFDPSAVLDETLHLLGRTVPAKVEVRLEKGVDPPLLYAARNGFSEMLANLLLNAVWAMPEGGVLRIQLSQAEKVPKSLTSLDTLSDTQSGVLYVRISDTGRGMSPGELERVFDPWFTTHVHNLGIGLGLVQVREFVEFSGGVIELDSDEGRGTSVEIWLSAASPPERSAGPDEQWALLINFDGDTADRWRPALGEHSIRIVTPESRELAFHHLETHGLDFAAVVVAAGGINSDAHIELLQQVRQRSRGLPLVAMLNLGEISSQDLSCFADSTIAGCADEAATAAQLRGILDANLLNTIYG
ncbi:MAG: signal transduction histidine kinase [Limisphaerales bacterium]